MTWAPCPHGVRTRGKKKINRSQGPTLLEGSNVLSCLWCWLDTTAVWVSNPGERVTLLKSSLSNNEKSSTVLPGSFANGVNACFDLWVPKVARMCEGVGDHLP